MSGTCSGRNQDGVGGCTSTAAATQVASLIGDDAAVVAAMPALTTVAVAVGGGGAEATAVNSEVSIDANLTGNCTVTVAALTAATVPNSEVVFLKVTTTVAQDGQTVAVNLTAVGTFDGTSFRSGPATEVTTNTAHNTLTVSIDAAGNDLLGKVGDFIVLKGVKNPSNNLTYLWSVVDINGDSDTQNVTMS